MCGVLPSECLNTCVYSTDSASSFSTDGCREKTNRRPVSGSPFSSYTQTASTARCSYYFEVFRNIQPKLVSEVIMLSVIQPWRLLRWMAYIFLILTDMAIEVSKMIKNQWLDRLKSLSKFASCTFYVILSISGRQDQGQWPKPSREHQKPTWECLCPCPDTLWTLWRPGLLHSQFPQAAGQPHCSHAPET